MSRRTSPYDKITDLFNAIGNPVRIRILLAIGKGEACVCHLEALLGLRQAYISQQLMVLRKKKIIAARREGKYIFYHLVKPEILELIRASGNIVGIPEGELVIQDHSNCQCPTCSQDGANAGATLPLPRRG